MGVHDNHHIKVLDGAQLPVAADVKRAIRAQTHTAIRVTVNVEGFKVAVGGWLPGFDGDGLIRKKESLWFHIELESVSAPWAFAKGLPYNNVYALVLLAITIGVVLLKPFKKEGQVQQGVYTSPDSPTRRCHHTS